MVKDVVSELNYRFSDDVLSLLQLCGALSPRVNFHDWNADKIVKLAINLTWTTSKETLTTYVMRLLDFWSWLVGTRGSKT